MMTCKVCRYSFFVICGILFLHVCSSLFSRKQRSLPTDAKILNICSIIERGGPDLIADYDRIAAAIELALNNSNNNILPPDVQLTFNYKDGGKICAPKSSTIRRLVEWTRTGIQCNIYIGPACSEAVLDMYQAAEAAKLILIGIPGAHTVSRSGLSRSAFKYLVRTTYTFADLQRALTAFMNAFNYTYTTIIINTESYFYGEMGDNFRWQYRSLPRELRKSVTFLDFTHDQQNGSGSAMRDTLYLKLLQEANLKSRVILLLANATVVRNIMIIAYANGMAAGEHVYICVEPYKSKLWGEFTWQNNDENDAVARAAYQFLLVISMAEVTGPQMDEFSRLLRQLSFKKYQYTFGPFEQIDPIVLAYYEAIILYANAVKTVAANGDNIKDSENLLREMHNKTLPNDLGMDIAMNENGDRIILYDIKSFSFRRSVQPYAQAIIRVDFVQKRLMWLASLQWQVGTNGQYSSTLPPNIPVCGFSGNDCLSDKTNAQLVAAAITVPLGLLIVAASLMNFMYRKMRHNSNPYWWRIYSHEVQFSTYLTPESGQSLKSLRSQKSLNTTLLLETVSPWDVAQYGGSTVGVYILKEHAFRSTAELVKSLEPLRLLRHQNLQRFIGLCLNDNSWITHIVGEVCSKGCLQDILEKVTFKLDWSFRFSFIRDIVEGLCHVHASIVESHGFLSSYTCLVDGRFLVKLSDYGLAKLHHPYEFAPRRREDLEMDLFPLLWRAPELLRQTMPPNGSQILKCYNLNNFEPTNEVGSFKAFTVTH